MAMSVGEFPDDDLACVDEVLEAYQVVASGGEVCPKPRE